MTRFPAEAQHVEEAQPASELTRPPLVSSCIAQWTNLSTRKQEAQAAGWDRALALRRLLWVSGASS